MSKAFDRLHPDFLRLKLQNLNVNDSLIHLIDSFLTGRSCTVRIGQHQSSKKRVTMGTPQGTKLGPWLWLVYVNDLLPDCPTIKYADDVTTYQLVRKTEPDATQKNLQMSLVDYISEWATANNMLLNSTKTQLIKFTLSEPKVVDQYSLSNRSITESPQCKLLGVTFDHRLTFTNHVDNIVSRTSFKLFTMRRLRRLGAGEKCLMQFYQAHILSVITYACLAWSCLIT